MSRPVRAPFWIAFVLVMATGATVIVGAIAPAFSSVCGPGKVLVLGACHPVCVCRGAP